eukprot:SAG22_NODE_2835_length_2168_cov_1.266312_4_plen_287_part_01
MVPEPEAEPMLPEPESEPELDVAETEPAAAEAEAAAAEAEEEEEEEELDWTVADGLWQAAGADAKGSAVEEFLLLAFGHVTDMTGRKRCAVAGCERGADERFTLVGEASSGSASGPAGGEAAPGLGLQLNLAQTYDDDPRAPPTLWKAQLHLPGLAGPPQSPPPPRLEGGTWATECAVNPMDGQFTGRWLRPLNLTERARLRGMLPTPPPPKKTKGSKPAGSGGGRGEGSVLSAGPAAAKSAAQRAAPAVEKILPRISAAAALCGNNMFVYGGRRGQTQREPCADEL